MWLLFIVRCFWPLCFLNSLLWRISSVTAKQRRRFLPHALIYPFRIFKLGKSAEWSPTAVWAIFCTLCIIFYSQAWTTDTRPRIWRYIMHSIPFAGMDNLFSPDNIKIYHAFYYICRHGQPLLALEYKHISCILFYSQAWTLDNPYSLENIKIYHAFYSIRRHVQPLLAQ